jgi:hypothetical protein
LLRVDRRRRSVSILSEGIVLLASTSSALYARLACSTFSESFDLGAYKIDDRLPLKKREQVKGFPS